MYLRFNIRAIYCNYVNGASCILLIIKKNKLKIHFESKLVSV